MKFNCPKCGVPNDEDWPITVNGVVEDGGCYECFDKEADAKWWEAVVELDELLN